jgi:hypothetical protein
MKYFIVVLHTSGAWIGTVVFITPTTNAIGRDGHLGPEAGQ